MSHEKPILAGPMLPSVLAGRAKRKVADLADGAYESLDDMKERTVLAIGGLKQSASD